MKVSIGENLHKHTEHIHCLSQWLTHHKPSNIFVTLEFCNNFLTSASPIKMSSFSSSENSGSLITFCPVLLWSSSMWVCFILPNRLSIPVEKEPNLIFLLFPTSCSVQFCHYLMAGTLHQMRWILPEPTHSSYHWLPLDIAHHLPTFMY